MQLAAGHRVAVISWDGDRLTEGNSMREKRVFVLEVTALAWPVAGDPEAAADALALQLRRVIYRAMPELNKLTGVDSIKLTERDASPDLDTPLTQGAAIRSTWDVEYTTRLL